jgi:hypothetical protein
MSFTTRVLAVSFAAYLLAPIAGAAPAGPQTPSFCPHCVSCSLEAGSVRVVRVKVYNQSRLSSASLDAVLEMAGRIWLPYGVTIEQVSNPDAVALVVAAGVPEPVTRAGRPVLGDTLFHLHHATPYIRLWLGAAEAAAAVGSTGTPVFTALPAEQRDGILLRMLGVAFAHELGHYLLDTGVHSSSGLLRAALTMRDLEEPNLARLDLTGPQQRSMCAR